MKSVCVYAQTQVAITPEKCVKRAREDNAGECMMTVGATTMPLTKTAICNKCRSVVDIENVRVTGKRGSCVICKVCNSRSTQLSTIYGGWPPKNFKTMDKDAVAQFYNDIKDKSGKTSLKEFTDEFIEISKGHESGSRDNTECLPLSVWKMRGFDVNSIEEKCKPIEHPVLGKCFSLTLANKWSSDVERHMRVEKVVVTDKAPAPIKAAPGSKKTREEVVASREQVRATKAAATQQARVALGLKKIAKKYIGSVVKASFNIESAIANKMSKSLTAKFLETGNGLKTELADSDKKLRSAMFGCDTKCEIDEDGLKKLCKQATDWQHKATELMMQNIMKTR